METETLVASLLAKVKPVNEKTAQFVVDHPRTFFVLLQPIVQTIKPAGFPDLTRELVADALRKVLCKSLVNAQQVSAVRLTAILHRAEVCLMTCCFAVQRSMPSEVLQLVVGHLSNKDLCKIGLTCWALYVSPPWRNLARLLQYVHTDIDFLLMRALAYAKRIQLSQEQAAKANKPGANKTQSLQWFAQTLDDAEQRGTSIRLCRKRFYEDYDMAEEYMTLCQGVQAQLLFDQDQLDAIADLNLIMGRDRHASEEAEQGVTLISVLKGLAIL